MSCDASKGGKEAVADADLRQLLLEHLCISDAASKVPPGSLNPKP